MVWHFQHCWEFVGILMLLHVSQLQWICCGKQIQIVFALYKSEPIQVISLCYCQTVEGTKKTKNKKTALNEPMEEVSRMPTFYLVSTSSACPVPNLKYPVWPPLPGFKVMVHGNMWPSSLACVTHEPGTMYSWAWVWHSPFHSLSLSRSPALLYFHGKKKVPQYNHHNPTNPSPSYCCFYLQTSNKQRMAILFACNRDSVYCLGYRLKARETRGERVCKTIESDRQSKVL